MLDRRMVDHMHSPQVVRDRDWPRPSTRGRIFMPGIQGSPGAKEIRGDGSGS